MTHSCPKRRSSVLFYYRHVVKAEQTGEREVTFTFDEPDNRELPQIVGQLTIVPKHWWEGVAADGKTRDIARTTLEAPLGSGPYKVASVRSEEHTSELQSLMRISYAVFCLKK